MDRLRRTFTQIMPTTRCHPGETGLARGHSVAPPGLMAHNLLPRHRLLTPPPAMGDAIKLDLTNVKPQNTHSVMRARAQSLSVSILAIGLVSFAGFPTLRAQNVDAGRADLAREHSQPLSSLYAPQGVQDGHAVSSPNDPDLGEQEILKRVDQYQPWTVSAAIPIYWTSNVALTDNHTFDDVIEAPV